MHYLTKNLDLRVVHGSAKLANAVNSVERNRPAADDVAGIDTFIDQVHAAANGIPKQSAPLRDIHAAIARQYTHVGIQCSKTRNLQNGFAQNSSACVNGEVRTDSPDDAYRLVRIERSNLDYMDASRTAIVNHRLAARGGHVSACAWP